MLLSSDGDFDLRVNNAASLLDDLANDPNIPLHGRTLIWNILNQLETLKTG